jgi:hypothetical protein
MSPAATGSPSAGGRGPQKDRWRRDGAASAAHLPSSGEQARVSWGGLARPHSHTVFFLRRYITAHAICFGGQACRGGDEAEGRAWAMSASRRRVVLSI